MCLFFDVNQWDKNYSQNPWRCHQAFTEFCYSYFMTLYNSSFAEAERLMRGFKEARVVDASTLIGSDIYLTQFAIPRYGDQNSDPQQDVAALHLINAALQIEYGTGVIMKNDNNLLISIPGKISQDSFPINRLIQGLHKVRRGILNALEQSENGIFQIDKTKIQHNDTNPLPFIRSIDLQELMTALAEAYKSRGNPAVLGPATATYDLPEPNVVPSKNDWPRGEVSGTLYERYVQRQRESGKISVDPTAAERRIKFDGTMAQALYSELGVDKPRSRHMH